MKEQEVMKALSKIQNGAFFKMSYVSDCSDKVLAAYKTHYNVIKIISSSYRKGIDYKHTKRYVAPIQERKSWFEHVDKTVIRHKTNGNKYLMVFKNPMGKPNVRYFVNSKQVSRQELEEMGIMQPSFFKPSDSDVLTIRMSNIISIN